MPVPPVRTPSAPRTGRPGERDATGTGRNPGPALNREGPGPDGAAGGGGGARRGGSAKACGAVGHGRGGRRPRTGVLIPSSQDDPRAGRRLAGRTPGLALSGVDAVPAARNRAWRDRVSESVPAWAIRGRGGCRRALGPAPSGADAVLAAGNRAGRPRSAERPVMAAHGARAWTGVRISRPGRSAGGAAAGGTSGSAPPSGADAVSVARAAVAGSAARRAEGPAGGAGSGGSGGRGPGVDTCPNTASGQDDLRSRRPVRALSVRRRAPDHVHSHLVGLQRPRTAGAHRAPGRMRYVGGHTKGRSSIGRALVSKTSGWGFKSLRPCYTHRQDVCACTYSIAPPCGSVTGRGTATTRDQVRTNDGRRGLHRHA